MTATKLFHHNTLTALMSGLYEGTITMSELLEQGDFGIGTLSGIEGEVIVLDGKVYQARGDKTVIEVPDEAMAPYAAVTHFVAEQTIQEENIPSSELLAKIEQNFASKNLFHAVKMTGKFDTMHVRMAPGGKEGQPFVEIAANQPEYTESNISGTIVGFWTPLLFDGVSVAGYHLHFLSDDHQFGGHILDFDGFTGQVEVSKMDQLIQNFPTENKNFLNADFNLEQLKNDIHEAE